MRQVKFGLLLLMCSFVYCQPQDSARPEFEVGSIKISAPPGTDRVITTISGGPGTSDPGLFRCTNVSLKTLITLAYSTTSFQVVAPGWMDSQMFDISAKLPAGATRAQFSLMLQNLLVDRLRVVAHHEQRVQAKYDLVVAKGGPKFKDAADPTSAHPRPALPKGRVGRYRPRDNMTSFAAYLTAYLGKLVNDATGLNGEYEINVSWVQEDPKASLDAPAGEPTIEHALLDQLGLELRSSRGPVDFLIVESADKIPTGN